MGYFKTFILRGAWRGMHLVRSLCTSNLGPTERTQEKEKKETTINFLSWRYTTKFTCYYSISQSSRWMYPNTGSNGKLPASLIRAGPVLMSLLHI